MRIRFVLIAAMLLAGCAHRADSTHPAAINSATSAPSAQPPGPTTAPSDRAHLTLEKILPAPALAPASRPSTEDAPAPALELYARAMDNLYQGKAVTAAEALESAVKIDPSSFALYNALGHAYLQRTGQVSDLSLAAFEHAATLRPDDLQIHILLARQYLSVNKNDKAVEHLRLAMQTSGYQADAPGSAAVELFLARALQQDGYTRAARDLYQRVSDRVASPTRSLRQDQDVGFVVTQPELLWLQIAQMDEQLGDYSRALALYEPSAAADPANFALQARVVQILSRLGRADDATKRVADLVQRFHASAEAIQILREVCQAFGYDREAVAFQRLHQQNPQSRPILFALSEVLVGQGKAPAARQLLEKEASSNPLDLEIVRKLFDFYLGQDDALSAARLLINALGAQPDSVRQMDPLLAELIRPLRKHALRLAALQNLQVPPDNAAAKLYIITQAATQWHREAVAHQSLEDAIKISPAFAPAYRNWMVAEWDRSDISNEQKKTETTALADGVQQQTPALAAEIRGLEELNLKNVPGALDAFGQAIQLKSTAPDLMLAYAGALKQAGRAADARQVLWDLVARAAQFDAAWNALYENYSTVGDDPQTLKVLARWLAANPTSELARLYDAIWQIRHDSRDQGINGLAMLLQDHSDDGEMVGAIEAIFGQLGQADAFTARLEALRTAQPTNLTLVTALMEIYRRTQRNTEASNLLDQTRAAVSKDPDLLYDLAALYHNLGQLPMWEEVLNQVLAVDAKNVPASNDLGYAWADEGKNLDRAEQMIRTAVSAEPDNQAFLDSLGWVLYKRGRFAEAEQYFQQAVKPAQNPDAEVLDHFGDLLYRMGRAADAQKQWERSLEQTQGAGTDSDLMQLRLRLQRKVHDAQAGQQVEVAPMPNEHGQTN